MATYSGMTSASAHSGETSAHVISHCLEAFSYMALSKYVKTDNGPAYVSHGFTTFLSDWNITHSTGILYNSQVQATIECAHRTLKNVIFNRKGEKSMAC